MTVQNIPGPKSERIVVDEIIDGAKKWPNARLLRAKRLAKQPEEDFGIHTWGDEREDCISAWRIEAFVGFPRSRKLGEGDVFFITDGSKLTNKYDPIPRKEAARKHLLVHWDEARRMARSEIKREFATLAAVQMAGDDANKIKKLVSDAEEKIMEGQRPGHFYFWTYP